MAQTNSGPPKEVIDLTEDISVVNIKSVTDWKFEDEKEQKELENSLDNFDVETKNSIVLNCYSLLQRLHGMKNFEEKKCPMELPNIAEQGATAPPKQHGKGENHYQIFDIH